MTQLSAAVMFICEDIFLNDTKNIHYLFRFKGLFHPACISGHEFNIESDIVPADHRILVFFEKSFYNRPCVSFFRFILQKLIRDTMDRDHFICHCKRRFDILFYLICFLIELPHFFHNNGRKFNDHICILFKSGRLQVEDQKFPPLHDGVIKSYGIGFIAPVVLASHAEVIPYIRHNIFLLSFFLSYAINMKESHKKKTGKPVFLFIL